MSVQHVFGSRLDTGDDLALSPEEYAPHMLVMGATGRGKTKFLENLLRSYLRTEQGFCIIDPTGNLAQAVLEYAAYFPVPPEHFVYFAPWRDDIVTPYNPLARRGSDPHFLIKAMKLATLKCWGQDSAKETPRIDEWLENCYYAAVHLGLTIPELGLLLQPSEDRNLQRRAILEALPASRPEWREPWEMLCQLAGKKNPVEYEMMVGATARRMSAFFRNPRLERIFGLPKVSLDLAGIMDNNGVLVVDLSPGENGRIHPEDTELIGTMLLTDFFVQMFSRKRPERPFVLAVDEFQNFITKDIARLLDMSRQFGIRLHLAHQRPGQLLNHQDPEMRDVYSACLTNCTCKVMFGGVSMTELEPIAKDMSVGVLDPYRVKDEIETIGVVDYEERVFESQTTGGAKSVGVSLAEGHGHVSGSGEGTADGGSDGVSNSHSDGYGFMETNNLSPYSTSTFHIGTGSGLSAGSFSSQSLSSFEADSESESQSVSAASSNIDTRTTTEQLIPVLGTQITSRTFEALEEQLFTFASMVHSLPMREAIVRFSGSGEPIPFRVPFVEPISSTPKDVREHLEYSHRKNPSLMACMKASRMVEQRKKAFLALGAPEVKPREVKEASAAPGQAPKSHVTVTEEPMKNDAPTIHKQDSTPEPIRVENVNLNERDIELLLGVYDSRFTSIPHAAYSYFTGPNISKPIDLARKRLKQLAGVGLLEMRDRSGKASYGSAHIPGRRSTQVKNIYVFTKKAYDVLVEAGRVEEVSANLWDTRIRKRFDFAKREDTSTIPHELAVFDVQVGITTAVSQQPPLRVHEFGTWPLRYEFNTVIRGQEKRTQPDGFIHLVNLPLRGSEAQNKYFFLEVDCSTETLQRLIEKMHGYNYHRKHGGFIKWLGAPTNARPRQYPFQVLFVATKGSTRRNNIQDALASAGYRGFALCAALDDVVNNPLGPVWFSPGSAEPRSLLDEVSTGPTPTPEATHATMKSTPATVS